MKNEGQSLIEFIMTFSFALGLLFILVNIAFNATQGYIVHYATYMASRTYMVIDRHSNRPSGSDVVAGQEAQRIFEQYIRPGVGTFKTNSPDDVVGYPYAGVSFEYKAKFIFGVVGAGRIMDFVSESFLGKEPTRGTCALRVCKAMEMIGGSCADSEGHMTMYDNGC